MTAGDGRSAASGRRRGGAGPAKARLLVVLKTTSYQTYVEGRRDPRTTALLAKGDPAVGRLLGSHGAHEATVDEVRRAMDSLGVVAQTVTTAAIPECDSSEFDLVVTVGGDGTLLSTSHAVGVATPILGINSAPDHSVGFFCGTRKGGVHAGLVAALGGQMPATVLSRMQVELNGVCLSQRVLNDVLMCHEVPAATSRYILTVDGGDGKPVEEEQKSSGLWIGPAAGSTAAQRSAGGHILPLTSRRIQYVVREPYTPTSARLALLRGTVSEAGSITVRSKMHQAKLFVDGPHVAHELGLGDVLTMRRSAEPLSVLGLSRTPRAEGQVAKGSGGARRKT
jgi:NAD+ kinase